MARSFGGTSDYFSLGTASSLALTGNMSAGLWIRTTTLAEDVLIGCYDSVSPFTGWGLAVGISPNAGKIAYWSNGSGAWRTATSTVNDGTWRHVGVRINGTGAGAGTFFRDGASDGTFTHTAPGGGTGTKYIGNSAFSNVYAGDMAEIGVWNTNLTDEEMAALAKGYSPLFIRPASLIFYAPLGGKYSHSTGNEVTVRGALTLTEAGAVGFVDHPPKIIYPASYYVGKGTGGGGGGFQAAWAAHSNILVSPGIV